MDEIIRWIEADKKQPFTIPNFGVLSAKAIRGNHLVWTGRMVSGSGIGADTSIEVSVDGDIVLVPATKIT